MISNVIARQCAFALAALALARSVAAQCPDGTPAPCRVAVAPARAAPPAPNSIAVLPLQNRSPDTADAYLAEGLTEEVLTNLAGYSMM